MDDSEPIVTGAGHAKLRPPHGFIIAGDSSIGELFVKCLCDWQTSHYVSPTPSR